MSYAVRNDGLGWRAVDAESDCGPDEYWQQFAPQLSEAQGKAARIAAIDAELSEIDDKGARPSRDIAAALATGSIAPAAAVQKLAELEAQAEPLRAERRTLTT